MASKVLNVSPSSLTKWSETPIQAAIDTYVQMPSDKTGKRNPSTLGSELHAYANESLKFLQEIKGSLPHRGTPSDSFIKATLTEASARASFALKSHTAQHMRKGVDSLVANIGSDYIRNKDQYLFSELAMTEVLTDTSGKSYNLNGIIDTGVYDAKKKAARVIDLKNKIDGASRETFDKASVELQGKANTFLTVKMLIEKGFPVDSAEFQVFLNPAWGPAGFINFDKISDKMIADIGSELAVVAANAQSHKNAIENKMAEGKSNVTAVKEVFANIVSSKQCSPGPGCRYCQMKFSCNMKFYKDLGDKLENTKNNNYKKGGVPDDVVQNPELLVSYESFIKAQARDEEISSGKKNDNLAISKNNAAYVKELREYRRQRMTIYSNLGMSDEMINTRVGIDMKAMRGSMAVARRFKRGEFEDSILNDALNANKRLPVSELDKINGISHTWGNTNLVNMVKDISYETVGNAMKGMGVDRPGMAESVVDKLFKSEKFVERFTSNLVDNARDDMYKNNLRPTIGNANRTMAKTSKILTNSTVTHLVDNLHTMTLKEIWKLDSEAIGKHIPEGKKFQRSDQDAIFNHIKSKGILKTTPEAFSERIAEMETSFGKTEKFKLSPPRNTISTIGKALILTQLAGNDTIINMINNKANKVIEFMQTQDAPIDTGEHNSTYGTMRRVLLSDFGSKVRLGDMVSGIYSKIAARGGAALKAAKDSAADYWRVSESSKIDPSHLAGPPHGLIVGGVAAGVALTLYSIVPRSPSREERLTREQMKKRSLKRRQEPQKSRDSYYQNPQSEMRSKYKIHGQFGSPWMATEALNLLKSVTGEEFVSMVASKSLALWNRLASANTVKVAKEVIADTKVGENLDRGRAVDRLKRAGKAIGDTWESSVQFIREKKDVVINKFKSGEMKESAMNLQQKLLSKDNLEGGVISPSSIGTSALNISSRSNSKSSGKNAQNNQPIIVKPAPKDNTNFTSGSATSNHYSTEVGTGLGNTWVGYKNIPEASAKGGKVYAKDNVVGGTLTNTDFNSNSTILTDQISEKVLGQSSFNNAAYVPQSASSYMPPAENRITSLGNNTSSSAGYNGVAKSYNDKMAGIEVAKRLSIPTPSSNKLIKSGRVFGDDDMNRLHGGKLS